MRVTTTRHNGSESQITSIPSNMITQHNLPAAECAVKKHQGTDGGNYTLILIPTNIAAYR